MRTNFIALALAWILAPTLGVCLFPATVAAGVVGSPHDFSRTGENYKALVSWPIAPGGACSACHVPHGAPDNVGWPRNLSYYSRTHSGSTAGSGPLDLRDGSVGRPDFLRATTVPCYDCHDRHQDGLLESTSIPLLADFASSHKPQNILSGFRKNSLGSMTEYGPGPQSGKVVPGYHENAPPGPSGNFGVTDPPPPASQTGGHYFQGDPQGSAGTGVDRGDKLPCSDCHDPHAWESNGDWQAFFRKNWPTTTIPGNLTTLASGKALASNYMANDSTPTNKRATDSNGANGRYLCIVCHGTYDSSAYPNRVRYSDVSSLYDNTSQVVSPPDTVGEHFASSRVACVSCHAHSSVTASCTMCHGFPPSDTATVPYPSNFTPAPSPGANDAHARHYGGKSGQPRNALLSQGFLYTFDCKECHYGSSMGYDSSRGEHQNDRVSVVLSGRWTKAPNIIGNPSGDNTNYFNKAQTYPPLQYPTRVGQLDNSNNVAGGGWGSGAVYGGNSCRNVYCHSAGRALSSMAADCTVLFRPVQWNTGKKLCNDCHGYGTDNTAQGAYGGRVNLGMPNYPNGGGGSTSANSHLAHVMVNGYECSVCHYNTVTGTGVGRSIRTDVFPTFHVNSTRNVVFNGTSASGSFDNGTKTCSVTCHGTDAPVWGGTLTGGCFACHNGIEQAEKPQPTLNDPNPVSLQEYAYSGHGRTGSAYTSTGNPPAAFDNYTNPISTNECYICHSSGSAHTTKNPLDPYRLGSGVDTNGQIGTVKGAFADNTDRLCLSCHGSDAERAGHPEAATGTNSTNALTHANGVTGDKYSSWPVSPWKCVDCHDPHGDGMSGAERLAMVRASVNAPTSSSDGSAGSDAYGTPRRTSGLTAVTFTSQAGMAPGSYASSPAKGQGICEICHTQTSLFNRSGAGNVGSHAARTGRCSICHVHKAGFKGLGGPDVGQYFDRLLVPGGGAENFNDNSSHPLVGLTDNTVGSLQYAADNVTINCLGCHYPTGPARTSQECLKCHFEEGKSPITNHMDGILQLARLTSNTTAPTSEYAVASLVDFDGFCLQCHGGTSYSLGGRTPSAARGTLVDAAEFAAGRHRAQAGARATGCIYCHAVHGEGNALLVRHNAANRAGAGFSPRRFGVFPLDNLDNVAPAYGRSGAQNLRYLARVDNTVDGTVHNVFADASDQNRFCSRACHSEPSEHLLLRDNTTGSYTLLGNRKLHVVDNVTTGVPQLFTIDNLSLAAGHVHVNGEIVPTDNMVAQYGAAAGVSGPNRYHYPNLAGNDPASYTSAINADYMNRTYKLPLFPDLQDGTRDFTNGYLNKGVVRYRYTCSTCHDPHGTAEPNANRGNPGWPDLRHRRTNPNTLCAACH